jgi:hypothetical protein
MFKSLDPGRRPVARKTLLRGYGVFVAISLLGMAVYTYKYSHRIHPESRIYVDLAIYVVALVVSAWRFLKVCKSKRTTQIESNSYVWCICVLLWLPALIRDLLT